jgi:uncharacterized protein (DUF1800 family)
LSIDTAAAIAANRFGLGARPGDLTAIGADPQGWLRAQLSGGAPLLQDSGLQSTQQILAGAEPIVRERREARSSGADTVAAANLAKRLPQYLRPIYVNDARERLHAAVVSERPFAERLVHFWSNHFAVSVDKLAVLGIAGSFEREAIRPHVMGRFRELLLAVETHPAMLLYLDNQQSVGPDSTLAQRAAGRGRTLGLNENLAREILELHTLGVDGGYTQTDVTSFAKVLTGWSLGGGQGRLASGPAGEFVFRAEVHEPGAQTILHKRYAQSDQAQGLAVLTDLAAANATARHIAEKLARHFIADDPPPAAIEHIARAFERSGGDLPQVYAAIIESPQAWQDAAVKFKTPQDYLFSLSRGLALPPESEPRLFAALELLGQRTFAPGSPAGWPDRSSDWDGSSGLMKRIELSDALSQKLSDRRDATQLAPQLLGGSLSEATRQGIARAASPAQGLTLLLTAPEFLRR